MTECDDSMLAYVRYRLEKSLEVYKAACVLYDAAQWNSVINRLYYACFYSASALLLYKHIIAKSHSGVIGQFSENMVRTGIFSVDEFRVYAKLLNWRSKGDYNDFFDFHISCFVCVHVLFGNKRKDERDKENNRYARLCIVIGIWFFEARRKYISRDRRRRNDIFSCYCRFVKTFSKVATIAYIAPARIQSITVDAITRSSLKT